MQVVYLKMIFKVNIWPFFLLPFCVVIQTLAFKLQKLVVITTTLVLMKCWRTFCSLTWALRSTIANDHDIMGHYGTTFVFTWECQTAYRMSSRLHVPVGRPWVFVGVISLCRDYVKMKSYFLQPRFKSTRLLFLLLDFYLCMGTHLHWWYFFPLLKKPEDCSRPSVDLLFWGLREEEFAHCKPAWDQISGFFLDCCRRMRWRFLVL